MNDIPTGQQALPLAEQAKFLSVEFGDPEPVLNKRAGIMDLLQSRFNGRWYEPPIPMDGLSRAFRASPHHSSAILLKRDMLLADFLPSKLMSRAGFSGLVLDYLVFGNGYLQELPNRFGAPARYERTLAKYVRVTTPKCAGYLQASRSRKSAPATPSAAIQQRKPNRLVS